jgi:hypothetical protein
MALPNVCKVAKPQGCGFDFSLPNNNTNLTHEGGINTNIKQIKTYENRGGNGMRQ